MVRRTMRSTVDQMVVMIPMILLLVDTPCHATRPRRRFCEFYPYAPRCLGVAAKRSPSRTDIYKSLINKVLAESLDENIPKDTGLAPTPPDLYDDRAVALNKLANIVLKAERERINRNALTDSEDTWSEQFGDYENNRGV